MPKCPNDATTSGPSCLMTSTLGLAAAWPVPYSNSRWAVSLDHLGTSRSGPDHWRTVIPSGTIRAHRA